MHIICPDFRCPVPGRFRIRLNKNGYGELYGPDDPSDREI